MRLFKYISTFAVLALAVYFFFFQDTQFQEISGRTFGTYYNVKIRNDFKNRTLTSKIKKELEDIDRKMSVFEPDSEINYINEAVAGETIEVSDDLAYLLKRSNEIYRLTDGNFDPTVGTLVDLWGFGTTNPKDIPDEETIKDALSNVGLNKLSFSSNYTKVKKNRDKLTINLSAIAKGYAVDRLAELLKNEGYNDFVIEIGGEVFASGEKSDTNPGWNVGVADPSKTGSSAENAYILRLQNLAAATSGDYRNYYYKDNKKYSHTISPQTGYPVEHDLISVTVFDKSCLKADAVATGIMAMGAKKGLDFANKNKLPVIMFYTDENNNISTVLSNAAKKLIETAEVSLPNADSKKK